LILTLQSKGKTDRYLVTNRRNWRVESWRGW